MTTKYGPANLIVLQPLNAICGYLFPFLIRVDPNFRMNLVLWDDLAPEDLSHEQVVIHGLGYNFSDG